MKKVGEQFLTKNRRDDGDDEDDEDDGDAFDFDFSEKDVWTMFHSVAFDFSVWEMYGALLYGGKLILVPEETAKNPQQFLQLLRQEKVTVLNQTPTYFYNLLDTELKQ